MGEVDKFKKLKYVYCSEEALRKYVELFIQCNKDNDFIIEDDMEINEINNVPTLIISFDKEIVLTSIKMLNGKWRTGFDFELYKLCKNLIDEDKNQDNNS
jgi:hypothetical protein